MEMLNGFKDSKLSMNLINKIKMKKVKKFLLWRFVEHILMLY